MTTLILAYRKIVPLRLPVDVSSFEMRFRVWNERGLLSLILLGIIGVSVLSYLSSLYITFGLGFNLQEKGGLLIKISEDYSRLEFTREGINSSLARASEGSLQSMEKASDVRYLVPKNVVLVEPFPNP